IPGFVRPSTATFTGGAPFTRNVFMKYGGKACRMVPSNVPTPPTGTALVGDPSAVMMPASTRSLSCQSVLVTWKGMAECSPYAVRPSKATYVFGLAIQDGSSVIQSESSRHATSPPIGTSPSTRGSLLNGPQGRTTGSSAPAGSSRPRSEERRVGKEGERG